MHRSLLVLAALAFIASCNEEEPAALFADVNYQLRCLDCTPVSPDGPKRDFSVVDGQNGTSLSCDYSGGAFTLEIVNEDFTFKLLDAKAGDDPGGQCQVRISEGSGNEYRGGCKPIGGGGDRPCEVEITASGSGFTGTVECHDIKHNLNATLFRHVVAPSTTDKPADISVDGCAGL